MTGPQLDKQELHTAEDEETIRNVLNEAASSPKAALLLLASEIERETRELLVAFNLMGDRPYMPLRDAIGTLEQDGVLPPHVRTSVERFWVVRNGLIHGRGVSDDAVLRAIDSGITILRALRAVPRERHTVVHPGLEVYADPQGQKIREGVKGIILESRGPDATVMLVRRMFGTSKDHFQQGKRVTWEWNHERRHDESWYRDPDTQEMKRAWTGTLDFVGRHLDDL